MNEITTQLKRDFARYKPALNLSECMRLAQAQCGKSYSAQVKDIYRLKKGDGKLSAQDYYYYRLYDDTQYSKAEKYRFLSESVHRGMIAKCCEHTWWATADDKFVAYQYLHACGLPVPETQAVYHPAERGYGRTPQLKSLDALAQFLAKEARYPIFAKPVDSVASFGAYVIRGYDNGQVITEGNLPQPVQAFAAELGQDSGYLLQSLLRPHPDLLDLSEMIGTIRVMIMVTPEGPKVLQTLAKIPAKGNIADNFWRDGNFLTAIDAEGGKITRAVRGVGPEMEVLESHPESGEPLLGLSMPDWDRLLSVTLEGARLYTANRYQSWDIALTEAGPVVVEVNTGSAYNLAQLATGTGILTDAFADFLESCGYKLKRAWTKV